MRHLCAFRSRPYCSQAYQRTNNGAYPEHCGHSLDSVQEDNANEVHGCKPTYFRGPSEANRLFAYECLRTDHPVNTGSDIQQHLGHQGTLRSDKALIRSAHPAGSAKTLGCSHMITVPASCTPSYSGKLVNRSPRRGSTQHAPAHQRSTVADGPFSYRTHGLQIPASGIHCRLTTPDACQRRLYMPVACAYCMLM